MHDSCFAAGYATSAAVSARTVVPDLQDDKKLAGIAAQAELHRSSTCVLIMMQKMKASQEQHPSSAEQHQPSSLQQPYAEDQEGNPDQVLVGMHCSSPEADREAMQQAALPASVQKEKHAKREHPDTDSPYSQSKRLKLQLDMYALQLAEQQGEPLQQQLYEDVDSKQEEVLVSIFSGMERLGLLHSSKHASQALSASQLEGLKALHFLTQLRFASLFAISYQKVGTVSQHFNLTMAALQQKPETTSWLIHRCGPPAKRTLCREAQELYVQLSADTEWPCNARADLIVLIAQVIPADLQPAYILSLAGYAGTDSLAVYAADVMQCILQAAHQAAQDSPTAQLAQRVTRDSLEQAATGTRTQTEGLKLPLQFTPAADRSASMSPVSSCSFSGSSSIGSPESKPSKHTQPHAPDKIDMNRVLNRVESALIRLRLLPTYLPEASVSRLQKVSFFHQLLVLSRFCATVEPRQDVPCCLMRLCKSSVRRHMMQACLHDVLPYSSDRPMKELTNLAWTVHVFETRQSQLQAEAALLVLLQQLQCVAACYAIGTFMVSRDNEEALLTVQHGISQMQDLFQPALTLRRSHRQQVSSSLLLSLDISSVFSVMTSQNIATQLLIALPVSCLCIFFCKP